MTPAIYIGLDVGTTAVKAIAFDEQGQTVAIKRGYYPAFSPRPDYVEQDPDQVFRKTLSCLLALIRTLQSPIGGIGLSGAMHSIFAVDADGRPLTRAVLWSDNRSVEEADKLNKKSLGKQLYERTGTPIHPMSPLCKLRWWHTHHPELCKRAARWVSLKEYLVFRLTGAWLIDYSIASATGLFDLHQIHWCEEALKYAQIHREQLSQPVSPEEILASTHKTLAGIPIVIGASDGCLANLGAGITGPGQAVMTVGTSAALRSNAPAPVINPHGRLFCYILSQGQYVFGGASNNGGNTWEWLNSGLFGVRRTNYQKRFDLAAQAPAGSEGLLFMPYLMGERAPLWNASAQAAFSGLTHRHKPAHLLRAALEGILFNLHLIIEEMHNTGGNPAFSRIVMSGGMAASPFFMQLAADIFGTKVCLSHTEELSAWGAAVLARKVLTGHEFAPVEKDTKTFYPNTPNHEIYRDSFFEFKLLLKKYKYL
ncbi:MAG: gluconokinase [Saprospiraceae bacterium]|nr:gluconokinase [Saprospiraceae bacterium]